MALLNAIGKPFTARISEAHIGEQGYNLLVFARDNLGDEDVVGR